jgi:putative modified peptide
VSAQAVEALLARLYSDAHFRQRFLADPRAVALEAGLDSHEAGAMERIDREGLELAADSYERKRDGHSRKRGAS